jgi:hypothetical protein
MPRFSFHVSQGIFSDGCTDKLIDAEGRSCIYVPITQDGKVVDSQGYAFDPEDEWWSATAPSVSIPITLADHFGNCPLCGAYLDMRDLGELLTRIHDQKIEIGEGPEPPRQGPLH